MLQVTLGFTSGPVYKAAWLPTSRCPACLWLGVLFWAQAEGASAPPAVSLRPAVFLCSEFSRLGSGHRAPGVSEEPRGPLLPPPRQSRNPSWCPWHVGVLDAPMFSGPRSSFFVGLLGPLSKKLDEGEPFFPTADLWPFRNS